MSTAAINATTPNANVIAPLPQNSKASLIRNAYEYFQNSNNSSLLKTCAAALAAFATLALGYLVGNMLLITSVMTTIVVLAGGMESERVQNEATIEAQKREIAHLEVTGAMGGSVIVNDNFQRLDLGDRESDTGAIDFLQFNEVRRPKRGVDKYGRQFYALLLEKRSDDSRHLLVFYEKYTSGGVWEAAGPQDLLQGVLTNEGRATISSLISNENVNYRAVEPQAVDGDEPAVN